MAQLPPKVPNIVPQNHQHQQEQWQEFMHPHQQQHGQNPPWVDEFIEFSAARRGVHRRSASESSVAFVEAGPVSFFHPPDVGRGTKNNMNNNNDDQFEKFDDEQFMSMFSNELGGPSSSNPSSTSDHNSTNDEQKRETTAKRREAGGREKAEEVESMCKIQKDEGQAQVQVQVQAQSGGEGSHSKSGNNVTVASASGNNTGVGGVDNEQQPVVDPKRVKRILANRQSAQRSRVRKLQYISELERSVTALQSEVSALSPRVAFLDHQRMILNVDNSTLKAKIAALAQDKIFKDAHQEAMKREIERLRQVYYQQNMNKTESIVPPPSTSSLIPTTSQPPPPDTTVNENEQRNS